MIGTLRPRPCYLWSCIFPFCMRFPCRAATGGRGTLFCICLACPWSARRVTCTVHRRVFCLRHALDASAGAVPCHAIEHAQGRRYNSGSWERMGRTREKDTRPVSVSSPKLVRSPPSSTNSLCNGDLALAHISTASCSNSRIPRFWLVRDELSVMKVSWLSPIVPDTIGQESPSGAHQFQSGVRWAS